MFEPSDTPRLCALPPGVDFARELVAGLSARQGDAPPEDWARVTLFVNTRRMQRRIREVFDDGPPRALPRIRLITDLALDPRVSDLPPPAAPLRRQLEIAQLVSRLLQAEPDFAPLDAAFDLADSLSALMDEMHGEGVDPDAITNLDVTDESGHWARSLRFFEIVKAYFDPANDAPGTEQRQRAAIEGLARHWQQAPPADPVIVAGSTGSRGATALMIEAVARLPQGAVVLPGFDFDMPQRVWDGLDDALTGEDHPQFRFRALMDRLGLTAADIARWTEARPVAPGRNALVSLSLRPAPVTDAWLSEGPHLDGIAAATAGLTLLEAPSPRIEAEAIALRLRHAIERGETAALITPDRMLTRQVASALDRWQVMPDDSAGLPLALSPPGRFLRQVADLRGQRVSPAPLLSLLKHPLCHSASDDRNSHLLRTRELELSLRAKGPAFPGAGDLRRWAERTGDKDPGRLRWADWLGACLSGLENIGTLPLATAHAETITLAETLATGPDADGAGGLWDRAAGRTARAACDQIARHADAGGPVRPSDYAALLFNVLSGGEVRDRDVGHPQVLIWGTLEARVQTADLTILGGMNEGSWPGAAAPDPWLNRRMRKAAGLLLPERRIGLAAHDYMQAVAGRDVWITRSLRNDEAETVPSRWINRLTNLLGGLRQQGGAIALDGMRDRARPWLSAATGLSDVDKVDPVPRPSPRPPAKARPRRMSVTDIATLIRDPYAIYARRILGLSALDPLTPEPDARLKGTVIHKVFEAFLDKHVPPTDPAARDLLLSTAAEVLQTECPWPTMRHLWLAHLDRVADWFLATEADRQTIATPRHFEIEGAASTTEPPVTLTAKADRIDISDTGVILYDYKTGTVPSDKAQKHFEKQLLLEAALVARGGFEKIGTTRVRAAEYIGVGSTKKIVPAPLDEHSPERVWSEFEQLMAHWHQPQTGFSARMAPERIQHDGDYDHLARRGEWDDTDPPEPEGLS